MIKRILSWLRGILPCKVDEITSALEVRLHVPMEMRTRLSEQTRPTEMHPEPLALLMVRYAAEDQSNVIVGVGIIPFPENAYVAGDAGANFSTRWLVHVANNELQLNCGLVLVHRHGGRGKPAFSNVDRRTNMDVIRPLSVGVDAPYGAMVLSDNSETAVIARAGEIEPARVVMVPDLERRGWVA